MFRLGVLTSLTQAEINVVINLKERPTHGGEEGGRHTETGTDRESGYEGTQISLNLQSLAHSNDDE